MRSQSLGDEVGQVGRSDRLQQALAMQRFEGRAVGEENVSLAPSGAGLGQHALQDLFRARAPHLDLDAVLGLESLLDGPHVLCGERGVEGQFALSPRAVEETLLAGGAGQVGNVGEGPGLSEAGEGEEYRGEREREECRRSEWEHLAAAEHAWALGTHRVA
jgi:hypothetical protein